MGAVGDGMRFNGYIRVLGQQCLVQAAASLLRKLPQTTYAPCSTPRFACDAGDRYNGGVATQQLPQGADSDQMSRRLIISGCLLLIFPCMFLTLALMFYLLPVLAYAFTGGL